MKPSPYALAAAAKHRKSIVDTSWTDFLSLNKSGCGRKLRIVRRKQRLGLGWLLLLLLIAGLPSVVFFAWRDQNPSLGNPSPPHSGNNPTDVEAVTPPVPAAATLPENPTAAVVDSPAEKNAAPEMPSTTIEVQQKESAPLEKNEQAAAPPTEPSVKLDWAVIAANPGRWPARTKITAPVDFPISVDGHRAGSTRVPAGTEVKVEKILEKTVEITFAEYSATVSVDETTLSDQLLHSDEPKLPKSTEPSSAPEKPAKTAAPDVKKDAGILSPRKNWQKPPGDDRISLIEFLKVLEHDTTQNGSLEVSEHPEIFRGVTLLMPLEEALTHLGIAKESIRPKSPVPHPGIPLFYRTFACKYSLVGEPDDFFSQVIIITDTDDRVVGIQYVCENPASKMYYPKEEFRTYNFILNRQKASATLKVGCEVTEASADVLMIQSWLYDDRHSKSLEISRWYLPKRIANFLRSVVEVRLGLSE